MLYLVYLIYHLWRMAYSLQFLLWLWKVKTDFLINLVITSEKLKNILTYLKGPAASWSTTSQAIYGGIFYYGITALRHYGGVIYYTTLHWNRLRRRNAVMPNWCRNVVLPNWWHNAILPYCQIDAVVPNCYNEIIKQWLFFWNILDFNINSVLSEWNLKLVI